MPSPPSAEQAAASVPGPSNGEVRCPQNPVPVAIGQVGTFSGVVAPFTASGRSTLAVWAKDINARGGLACHPVVVYSVDDGGDPARAAAAVQDLVDRHKVVAIVGSFVALSIGGFRSAVESARVPAIGGDLASSDWFDSAWMFAQGASIDDQTIGLIRSGVELGHKRVGLLYCVEASTCAEGDRKIRGGAAKAAGADLVYDSPVSITQTDYTAQCLNARNAAVDQLTLAVDGSSMERIARSCAAIGYRPLLTTAGGIISPAQAADSNLRSFGLATVTANAPWMLDDLPGLRAYHAAIARFQPNLAPDGASVIAWSSAQLLESALRALGGDQSRQITRTDVLRGLAAIHLDTLGGLSPPISFDGDRHHPAAGLGCVFEELLTRSGWTAPHGSTPMCLRH